ncbi:MAG: nicotinate phosphoribosyltransferase [Acidobacteria bacterium]|nr:nicotinate phosphoribosyltransferase [Acidobacteriota bacterium]
MSVFDKKRLPTTGFKLDGPRMCSGWYSDKYFSNIVAILSDLANQGYRFGGKCPDLSDVEVDLSQMDVGNSEVEMQFFTRRRPFAVVAGVDKALAILKLCSGYFDQNGQFINKADTIEVEAVHDGVQAPYEGETTRVFPVLKVRGRYVDFAMLETPVLGALSRGTRVATNVYEVLRAARGKPVLFFPARFDAHEVQAADGYAYRIAVELFNHTYGQSLGSFVSTDAQGDWWGGAGGGTVAHAAIACFLGDTAEAMMAFAATRPPEIPRIALVDFKNDSVGDSLQSAQRLFLKYAELVMSNRHEEAKRFKLFAVRLDTSGNVRDISLPPIGDKKLDCGVNPRLVMVVRQALDTAYEGWDLPFEFIGLAKTYCREIKIVVSGGFNPEKIQRFEELNTPVDIYGVGTYLLSNCDHCGTNTDFTADIVRVKVNGRWYPMAKVGRRACDNPHLETVRLAELP